MTVVPNPDQFMSMITPGARQISLRFGVQMEVIKDTKRRGWRIYSGETEEFISVEEAADSVDMKQTFTDVASRIRPPAPHDQT